MSDLLQRAWLRRGLLAWLLWPLSLVYGVLVALRVGLYRTGVLRVERVPCPVVVVGNIVAGGAGKTPVVIALVEHLRARGLRPAVISRGWGRGSRECAEVLVDSDPADVGDEPLLIARASGAPVFVARSRALAAKALLLRHPATDVIICDDGLQHYALHRDIELCVYDQRLAGNGFLLPAGPLRESKPRTVDFTLCDDSAPLTGAFPVARKLADSAIRADGSSMSLEALRGHRLVAVAGIAKPQAFFNMLQQRGLAPELTMALPDHYSFAQWKAPIDGMTVVCTEKDAMKLWRRQPDAWAVPLRLTLAPAFLSAFDRLLDAKLSSAHGPQTT